MLYTIKEYQTDIEASTYTIVPMACFYRLFGIMLYKKTKPFMNRRIEITFPTLDEIHSSQSQLAFNKYGHSENSRELSSC